MSAILKRELMNYFLTPIGYIYTGVFVLMNAFFLVTGPLRYGAADMRALFSNSNAVFMFLTAILTMRLLSEERGKKTDQLLLTSPVSVWEIVIGKYLAAVCVFLTALVFINYIDYIASGVSNETLKSIISAMPILKRGYLTFPALCFI